MESTLYKCRTMTWLEAVKNLRDIQRGNDFFSYQSIFGGGYRSVHLILPV